MKAILVAGVIGAGIVVLLAGDSSLSTVGVGAAVGVGVQIGVRLLGVS